MIFNFFDRYESVSRLDHIGALRLDIHWIMLLHYDLSPTHNLNVTHSQQL